MTTRPPTHVVVDGSNIATEGRSMPSLAQLNDAVLAYRAEHPHTTITVVVDATFGHRIAKSEIAEFDAAIANNELVAPPAGAVGRGDAFVLGIANKAHATVLSNDSFQEFHGTYEWLFDEGRLVGGKPVPHVGWVFVERTPVRGPVSRKAVRESKRPAATGDGRRRSRSRATAATSGDGAVESPPKKASREASLPMPVPTAPPPGRAVPTDGVNELMPFLEFVERHPVGTSVNAVVDSYSSHGAYVRVGDVRGYVPLRMMGDPPPRSARDVMKVGDAVTLVVASFAPARRSIDLSLPQMPVTTVPGGGADAAVEAVVESVAPTAMPAAGAKKAASRRSAGTKRAAAAPDAPPAADAAPEPAPARGRRRKAAASVAAEATAATAPETPPVDREASGASGAGKKPAARKQAAKKAPVPPAKAPREKAADTPPAAPTEQAAPAKRAAKKPATKQDTATTKRAAATKKSAPTKKATTKKAAAPPPADAPAPRPRRRNAATQESA